MYCYFLRTVLFFIVVLITSFNANAQSKDDSLAHELIKKHILLNSMKQTVPGFRIQLFFGGQRERAYEVRTDFLREFADSKYNSYVIYQQPNFKVRIGDCRTRLDAMKLLKEVQPFFGSAFIVKDEVKLSY